MNNGKTYPCSLNVLWLKRTCPLNTLINRGQLEKFRLGQLSSPGATLNMPFIVAVSTGQNPAAHKGNLDLLSPVELLHAIIKSVAIAIQERHTHAQLEEGKRTILSTLVKFECVEQRA